MSNRSLLSGSPVLPVLCCNWDRLPATSSHQPSRHTRSMNWQLSKLFELDSNITQISTHFLKYYTNIYTLSPGFDGLQEGLQCFKKIEIKNTLSTTKKNSHPFNASDKYHVCVGSKQSKLNCKQASSSKTDFAPATRNQT